MSPKYENLNEKKTPALSTYSRDLDELVIFILE